EFDVVRINLRRNHTVGTSCYIRVLLRTEGVPVIPTNKVADDRGYQPRRDSRPGTRSLGSASILPRSFRLLLTILIGRPHQRKLRFLRVLLTHALRLSLQYEVPGKKHQRL